MEKDKHQDRIDDYLLGRAGREERLEFEEEVTRNPELSNELAATELAMAAIELAEDRALKARLQKLEATLAANDAPAMQPSAPATPRKDATVVTMKRRERGRFNLFAYAAALLLLLAVGWWALQTSSDGFDAGQLAMDSFEPYPNITTGTVRGSDELPPEAAAFADYDTGNYAAAEAKFKALPTSDVHQFYLAQSLLAQQKFAESSVIFTALAQETGFALAPEAGYYRALALLGTGEAAQAKTMLEGINGEAGHPMQGAAKELLAKL